MKCCAIFPKPRRHTCNVGWLTGMITCMSDYFWKALLPEKNAYMPWLRDHGSLTLRIQQRCAKFGVRNMCDCLMTAAHDETALLDLPSEQKIYTREVFLLAENQPVVFAHSVVAPQHLRGA